MWTIFVYLYFFCSYFVSWVHVCSGYCIFCWKFLALKHFNLDSIVETIRYFKFVPHMFFFFILFCVGSFFLFVLFLNRLNCLQFECTVEYTWPPANLSSYHNLLNKWERVVMCLTGSSKIRHRNLRLKIFNRKLNSIDGY